MPGGVTSGVNATVVLVVAVVLPRPSRRPVAVTVAAPAARGVASVRTTVSAASSYTAAVTLAPVTANAAAVTVAGSVGSSRTTVTVRPSGETVAETRRGPTTSGAKTLFWRPGVARAGSVDVAKLRADVLGPLGSFRSSDASVPPHDAR